MKPFSDGAIPSGNSVAALVLLRLAGLTGENDFHGKAEQIVRSAGQAMRSHPTAYTHMLRAVDFYLSPRTEIAVVGTRGAPDTERLLAVIDRSFLPNAVLAFLDPAARDAAAAGGRLPVLAGRTMVSGAATVYVCENSACRNPVTDAESLATMLRGSLRADEKDAERVKTDAPGGGERER
jgi:uncharacterized protein YyaL (SSP411 family)